jgi:murein DD-endopeptidase MepM/ murein hydrolase activator NlpD
MFGRNNTTLFALLGAGVVAYALMGERKWQWFQPVPGGRVTSGFGMRTHPVTGQLKFHNGIDLAGSMGTPIYAAGNGKISQISQDKKSGLFIIIQHDNGYLTGYAHLHKVVKTIGAGQKVKGGQQIALMGSSGMSTGPHLHFTLTTPDGTKIDPQPVFYPA